MREVTHEQVVAAFNYARGGDFVAESIDELQIEITASSDKASQSIDKLCKNLEKLKTGIASIDTSGFTNSMKTIADSLN